MTILGIDPGLANTGYGIIRINGNEYTHLVHGVIKTHAGLKTGERLLIIHKNLKKIIKEFKPEEAGIETLFFAKNVKTALHVSEAIGAILLCLCLNDVPCSEYTPLKIKQAVSGRGRAEKRQIMEMIKFILKLKEPPISDHASDALAVAICHSHYSHLNRLINRKSIDRKNINLNKIDNNKINLESIIT